MLKRIYHPSLILINALILCILVISAIAGSKAATVFTEYSPAVQKKCVIIDAGHGGEDGGATSCTGVLESSINLEIALRLEDLMHLLGIETVMIRRTDISVYTQGNSIAAKKVSDLKQRVKIANQTKNAVLISIHQNHFSDSQYGGAQVFYAPVGDSDQLAKSLQSAIVQSLNPGSNRKAKRADGVYLMQHIECPGILVECGFLSNPEEEAKLRSEIYQKKLCCVIAAVTDSYLHGSAIA